MKRRIFGPAVLIPIIAACGGDPGSLLSANLDLPPPLVDISDGAHGGTPHFLFLPPLVPHVMSDGVFDPSLSPVVQVCEWTGTECVLPLIAEFTTEGRGSERVRVADDDEHYIVNWHIRTPLTPGAIYRISVLSEETELGYLDAQAIETGRDKKGVDQSQLFALKIGRTLPIKFRIDVADVPASVLDLVIVLDGSQSVAGEDFQAQIALATELVSAIDLAASGVAVGLVDFGSAARTILDLSADQTAVANALAGLVQQGGDDCIACGLTAARSVLDGPNGNPSATKVIVIFADGPTNPGGDAVAQATEFKDAGGIVIGIQLPPDGASALAPLVTTQPELLLFELDLAAIVDALNTLLAP